MTTARNIAIVVVQKYSQIAIGAISIVTMSRLIGPEETGIFSVGMAIMGLTHAVRDFGVGNYLIREVETTPDKIQSAFTVSLIIALSLGLVLWLIAAPAAAFYGNDEVAWVIRITTFGLVISPFSTIKLALLTRHQRFSDLMKVGIGASIANFAVSVPLAIIRHDAISLAAGSLASAVTIAVIAQVISAREIKLGLNLLHWRKISRYGLHATISGGAEQLGTRAPDLIVGRMIGLADVGILSRANSLVTLSSDAIFDAVGPVLLSGLAADHRNGREIVQQILAAVEMLSVVLWPLLVGLALCSHEVVAIFFGSRWLTVAPYMAVLCLAALFNVFSAFTGVILTAIGRVDLLSRYNVVAQGIKICVVFLGATGNLLTLVYALTGLSALLGVASLVLFQRLISLPVVDVLARTFKSAAITLLVAGTVWLTSWTRIENPATGLAIAVATAVFVWVAGAILLRHPIAMHFVSLGRTLAARFGSKIS